MNREDIFDQAHSLTSTDRQASYGSPRKNHERIAKLWSVVLGIEIEPWQVALCMVQVKVSRLIESPDKLDSWIDATAYAGIGGELATETQ
jgi:hypothetical protein